jgi:hypothetical protein
LFSHPDRGAVTGNISATPRERSSRDHQEHRESAGKPQGKFRESSGKVQGQLEFIQDAVHPAHSDEEPACKRLSQNLHR